MLENKNLTTKKVTKDLSNIKKFDSYTIRSNSPAGSIYLHILEHEEEAVKVLCSAGKCGTEFSTFVNGICALINELLDNGVSLSKAMNTISGMNTDKSIRDGDIDVKSGISGIYHALQKYQRTVFERNRSRETYVKRMDTRNSA